MVKLYFRRLLLMLLPAIFYHSFRSFEDQETKNHKIGESVADLFYFTDLQRKKKAVLCSIKTKFIFSFEKNLIELRRDSFVIFLQKDFIFKNFILFSCLSDS